MGVLLWCFHGESIERSDKPARHVNLLKSFELFIDEIADRENEHCLAGHRFVRDTAMMLDGEAADVDI